uniref:Uncharacterized protein n=1 Tax=Astatotilapia calliptera TaxID=8154 RepID=A0A3P8NCJ1_ASTCA
MANIIFAERENAGLHAPTQKMRQRLQSAPEKLVKSPTKPFSTPLPSGRKAFGCLNVKVSTPAISKQEKKLLKQPPVCLEETKAKNAPQANVEYPETEKLFSYDPLALCRSFTRSPRVVLGSLLTVLMIILIPRDEILRGAPDRGRLSVVLFTLPSLVQLYNTFPGVLRKLFGLGHGGVWSL